MSVMNFHEGAQDKTKNEEEEDFKKRHQPLLFFWSVEGNRMSTVSLCEPPDNDLFDSLAQEVMRKLDKEETPAEEEPEENKKATAEGQQKSNDDPSSETPPRDRRRAQVEAACQPAVPDTTKTGGHSGF